VAEIVYIMSTRRCNRRLCYV